MVYTLGFTTTKVNSVVHTFLYSRQILSFDQFFRYTMNTVHLLFTPLVLISKELRLGKASLMETVFT